MEYIKSHFAAGIVLFNPDYSFVNRTIAHLSNQVDLIILVDNSADSHADELVELDTSRVIYRPNFKNLGIASALNSIVEIAHDYNKDWVLTLDQDSDVDDDYLSSLFSSVPESSNIGIVGCRFFDSNTGKIYGSSGFSEWCITSGSVLRYEAWKSIGGFRAWLFIDRVDNVFCFDLQENGWSTYISDGAYLKHSLGYTTTRSFLGHSFVCMNYSSFRRFYIYRNDYFYHHLINDFSGFSFYKKLFYDLIVIMLFEEDKVRKIVAIFNGVRDGRRQVSRHLK